MLRRKIMNDLIAWKSNANHKCLLIKGQRQVGKTFIIREFSKTYKNSLYIDFNADENTSRIFDMDLNIDRIITSLKILYPHATIEPKSTLIIFDEIQMCPRARSSLKYFTMDGRYDVIASGSLLDVNVKIKNDNEHSILPVGYEEHLHMRGLDFEEFLWAKGYSENQVELLKNAIRTKQKLDEPLMNAFNNCFNEFMMVGGMPESVYSYVTENNIETVRLILNNISNTFLEDVSKYSSDTDALKIRKCYQSIPLQLSETYKKFMWSRIDSSGSKSGSRKYADAIFWIENSGIGNCCNAIRDLSPPVSIQRDPSQFKVYLSDTGMLVNMMGPRAMQSILLQDPSFNQGALMENEIAECLVKSGYNLGYYIHRKEPGRMELDFVIDLGLETAAIEVKSGKSREAPSLSKTIKDDRIQRRIMFERANISVDEYGIEHYPLFAAAFVREMQNPISQIMHK